MTLRTTTTTQAKNRRRDEKIAWLKKHGHLAFWVFEKRPDDLKERKKFVELMLTDKMFASDADNVFYRMNVFWNEHYLDIVGERCQFDISGVCTAQGCFDKKICGARNRLGYPAYA